ncbi:ABC-2 type transporter [compost metagenome]
MKAFMYGAYLQWKLDFRNKGVILIYYVVPLLFFAFMGGIFTSINPLAKETIIQSMTVFSVSMGALIGAPVPLVELYGSEIKKAYRIGKIPLWTVAGSNFISGFIHLFLVSLLIVFIAPIAFDAVIPEHVGLFLLILALFIAACMMIGTILGVTVKSNSRLTMVSQLIFLPSIMLSGIMFPVDMLPAALEYIGKLFPATWGFINMCSSTMEAKSVLPLVIILAASFVICIWRIKRLDKI